MREEEVRAYYGEPLMRSIRLTKSRIPRIISLSGFLPASTEKTFLSVKRQLPQVRQTDAKAQLHGISFINRAASLKTEDKELKPFKGYGLYMINDGHLAIKGG